MSRVTVTLDDALLRRIDEAARQAGLSRSAYLARLAARELDLSGTTSRREGVEAAVRRLRERSSKYRSAGDSTKLVRELRDES